MSNNIIDFLQFKQKKEKERRTQLDGVKAFCILILSGVGLSIIWVVYSGISK